MTDAAASEPSAQLDIARLLARESSIWAPFALLTFVIASVLMSGWPEGLIPNVSYPYSLSGDGLAVLRLVQSLIEGNWIFHANRSGYPFGADLFDYPMSDAGSLIVLKILGWCVPTNWAATNLYFLLGFPITFAASYVVLRTMRISWSLATAGSVLFALLPYHFLRLQQLQHLFLTWYFAVPVFFLFGWRLYWASSDQIGAALRGRSVIIHIGILLALGSFGIYYALFGIIVILIGGMGGWLRGRSVIALTAAVGAASVVAMAVGINVLPNAVYIANNGVNPEVAHRGLQESEIYGLKLVQLALPRADHRISRLAEITQRYDRVAPLVNENASTTLGMVGTVGLLLLCGAAVARLAGRATDERLAFLGLATLCLFAVSTIGGVSAIFSTLVTPLLRGWNRVSVFVAFGAIASAMIALDWLVTRYTRATWISPTSVTTGLLVSILGAFDQTVPACRVCNRAVQDAFERDRSFVRAIEQQLPIRAAIYQIPYMPFPEVPPLNRLGTYDLAAGAVYSKSLRWSYGGMKAREGDRFMRMLSERSIATQVDVMRLLRFSGIYVDRRGYKDGGRAVEEELRLALGRGPALIRSDGQVAFYTMDAVSSGLPTGMNAAQVMQVAGFTTGACGIHSASTAAYQAIDFRQGHLPELVRGIQGLSGIEGWGRWSDANLRRSVAVDFTIPLPKHFTLVLRAQAFGPNAQEPTLVKIGDETTSFTLSEQMEEKRLRFDLHDDVQCTLEIIPPKPISPAELGSGEDGRKLGIGLERISIER